MRLALVAVLCACFAVTLSFAAERPTVLRGTTSDSKKGVLPGTEVVAEHLLTSEEIKVFADDTGHYVFSPIPPGVYNLRANSPGFSEKAVEAVNVPAGQIQIIDIVLEIVALKTETQVRAAANPIGNDGSEMQPLDTTEIDNMPVFKKEVKDEPLFFRGRVDTSWYGALHDSGFYNQISNRIRMDVGSRPGSGWTFNLDLRNRHRSRGTESNQLTIYNARLTFDDLESPFFFSFGEMNLYDTVGIGRLLGGGGWLSGGIQLAGWRLWGP